MDKKTVSIPEDLNQFLKDTGINTSRVLREAVTHLKNKLSDEEIEALKRMKNLEAEEFEGMELRGNQEWREKKFQEALN